MNQDGKRLIGDFTALEKTGTYHVWIPVLGRSCSFEIGNNIYADVLRATLKAFYYQRSSIPIEEKYGGKWSRKAGHPDTSLLMHSSTGKSGKYSSPGGWYDAGDYGKYIVNGGISVNTLMLLWEVCPDLIDDNTLLIPETGNEESDLLDEIKFELDWFKTMQDSDGGTFFKIGPMAFPDFIMPEKDTAQRYVIGKSTASTLNLAAVMAQAGRVFKFYDYAYAEDCIERAKRAWKWAEDNPSVPHPYVGGGTGLYNDGGWSDEKLWAATELWVTTGDAIYGDYCLPLFGTNTYPFSTWGDVNNQHLFPIMFKKDKYATDFDSKVKEFLNYIKNVKMHQFSDDFNVLEWADFWGSNGCQLNTIISLLACYNWTSDTTYINGASRAIDYIFGRNEYSKCFVTGFGYNPPRFPHHRISGADGVDDPVPGFVVGGPNNGHEDDSEVEYPAGIHYLDEQKSFASNEVAINWNAPLVFVLGYLENLHADIAVRSKKNLKNSIPEILSLTPVRKGIYHGVIINGIPSTVNTLKVKLFSLNGRCVSSQYLNNVKKNTMILFDTRELAGQVYLLSVDGEGISLRRRLMLF
ncbi:MAG: cellulase [Fibrobacter sp.]|jgi:endoglucanase|nr:cellulase [Fibrobacter sp.]